ncbi:peptidoglycan DD-metalloendopeptidase family protein [Thauera sp.]|uniref:murein hydrolase activator EnvC family protein n=1 Tax=Thauera sp. TaxID=1905334 RepID=UPI0026366698|nr:peptidoglycan DD-metalloendopeptidase family protein [Thauera sp.]
MSPPSPTPFLAAAYVAALLGLAGLPVPAFAQAGAEIAERRSDLDELKKRIRDLQDEMAKAEADRSSAQKALAESERAVSRAARDLAKVEGERKAAEKQLALLEGEQRETAARIEARRGELAEWLRRHYVHGAADGVAPLLSARDPNQLARDAHYLEQLGQARLALIEGLRTDLAETRRRAEEIGGRRDRLAALEAEQRARRAQLQADQARRKTALAEVTRELQTTKQQVNALQHDEQRLGQVIETLARRAREAAAREAARRLAAQREAERREAAQREAQRREAERRAALAAQARAARAPEGAIAGGSMAQAEDEPAPAPARSERAERPQRPEPVIGEVRDAAGATPTGVRFGQLRGQLRFPVRGELVGRFGAPRAEGGTTWKGVFIRAGSGVEVRAVAGGEVVFSDWLRGYGNLIIVDHGSDYLSIYGNNDSLLKEVGDNVGGGDPIASVGTAGIGNESGLYFEIRHRGQPLDPLQWMRLN